MLARIALRIAVVEALKGNTLVADNVLDSPNGALDVQNDGTMTIGERERERPFVSVFTDDGVAEKITGRSMLENGSCVLVLEAGVSVAMTEVDEQTGVAVMTGVAIPPTDRGMEFFLNVAHRQAMDALNDPDNEWAELYRRLVIRITKREVAGRRSTDDGQRIAGQQTRITLDLIDDPVRGEALPADHPIAVLLARLDVSDDETYRAQAATMRALIGGTDPAWKVLQRRHGMTVEQLRALGRGPVVQDEPRETPELTETTVAVDGVAS